MRISLSGEPAGGENITKLEHGRKPLVLSGCTEALTLDEGRVGVFWARNL
jgi:hypothetical protein